MSLVALCNILAWILCILVACYLARDFFHTEQQLKEEDSSHE